MDRKLTLCIMLAGFQVLMISTGKIPSKAAFELFSGENQGSTTNLLDKSFHQCSMASEDCNFVVKNTHTNKYSRYANEAQIPKGRNNLVIFKKAQRGMILICTFTSSLL